MNASRQSQSANRRTGWASVGAAVLVLCAGLGESGCSHKDPNKSLTDPEGQALLDDIRNHPPKPDDLTPAEKSYLNGYLATHK